ncbi:MAG: aryl-sulfate sulfotransferase [Desulfovibrionaceae bacterium]
MRVASLTVFCLLFALPALAGDYAPAVCRPEKMFPGTVLLTDCSDPKRPRIVEVDATGRAVWEYRLPPALRPKPRTPLPLGDATPLPNGDILFTVHGKGVFEIDRQGRMVWKHLDQEASHDADRLANGNTLYNRGWVGRGEDAVREVSPQGEVVWAWTGLPAFEGHRHEDIDRGGWMHVNACERLDDGSTLISIRNFNSVVRVNRAGDVVWSYVFKSKGRKNDLATPEGLARGAANHEPELSAPGRMLVAVRKPHAVYDIDLTTGMPVRIWTHPDGLNTIRDCNRLPNGNLLITGADKIVEVTPDNEIVWEIRAPATRMDKPFHRAIKIGTDGAAYGG